MPFVWRVVKEMGNFIVTGIRKVQFLEVFCKGFALQCLGKIQARYKNFSFFLSMPCLLIVYANIQLFSFMCKFFCIYFAFSFVHTQSKGGFLQVNYRTGYALGCKAVKYCLDSLALF
jgi:hypothetical protein